MYNSTIWFIMQHDFSDVQAKLVPVRVRALIFLVIMIFNHQAAS
jgi:hypothetical protein